MANESRPRREPSSTPRIRKPTSPSAPAVPEDPDGGGSAAVPPYPGSAESSQHAAESPRDRQDREPYREEGPADREPIRFIRDARPRTGPRTPEREPGLSVRERLARDRAERDGGPIHHEGIPMARDRDRDAAPLSRERPRDLES